MATVDPYAYPIDIDRYRRANHGWLTELDDVVVHAGLPHQRMGTRAIDEADWFRADGHAEAELALKRRLLAKAPGEVFAALVGSEEACAETAELVGAWLAAHRSGGPRSLLDEHLHPLQQAALGVQDDLCVMQRADDGWRLTAAVLCFPTYWRLADKLGRSQQDIHGPVPHYAADLADKVTRFFDRLAPDRVVCRRNWGFSAHPLLFVPDKTALRQLDHFDPAQLWLRSERQTLRRLARSGAVLFTIRVQLAPALALPAYPELAARLLAALGGWSPELMATRGDRHGWYDEVTNWLRSLTAQAPRPG